MGPSFEDTFSTEFPSLYAYFARRLGASMAEELTAETFAVAFGRWGNLDTSRPVRPWLYGIAANLMRHHWRSERRMLRAYARTGADPVVADDVSLDRLDGQSARTALAAALANLRRQERDVLLLSAWAEFTETEIAEALALPLGTVKSRLSRAREHMRNGLAATGQVKAETVMATEERQ